MPSLNFPTPTAIGEQYLDWVWNGVGWDSLQTLPGGLPAGSIIQWGGATAPVNWLLCDGSAVSRTTYASLFAAIGTSYGTGDGSTTFNLPDLRGRVPVGKNGGSFGTLGATGGAETHTLSINEMPSHTHVQNSHNHTQDAHNHAIYGSNGGSAGVSISVTGNSNNDRAWYLPGGIAANTTATNQPATATNQNTGGGQAHNNLQPYQVVNYIIKATAAITPGESELAPRVSALETADATTNRSGLIPVVPSSVVVSSGSASTNATGTISFTGAGSMSVNGAFTSSYKAYRLVFRALGSTTAVNLGFKFRASGTDWASGYYGASAYSSFAGNLANADARNNGSDGYLGGMTSGNSTSGTYEISPLAGQSALTGIVNVAYAGAISMMSYSAPTSPSPDGITIYPTSGTMTGTLQIYGYR